ncbi:MAG: phosphoadenylyl-sulfate reductase [Rhodospirillaceae bacterium]|nr:phosphoadenylyl-sulfate reductase [Rhodospirillaceae bacterium]
MGNTTVPHDLHLDAGERAPEPAPGASARRGEGTLAFLRSAILHDFPGRIALVSSFGAEAVVLLHMVARINPATPVLFNETGMLFAETLAYQREVADELGLTNVRRVRPTLASLAKADPAGTLHAADTGACCHLRKVVPLNRALEPYAAWITGRKRFQAHTRSELPFAEYDDARRVKLNPLADWSLQDIRAYMIEHDLPRHPLVARGYGSIGCAPCTTPVAEGEDPRAGRWRDQGKTECGIHFVDGKPVRIAVAHPGA